MITGILFYEKELEDNLKTCLIEGIKITKTKHNYKVTTIALNRGQFEVGEYKSVLDMFEKKDITVLLLNDINKNNYLIGYKDKSSIRPESDKELLA